MGVIDRVELFFGRKFYADYRRLSSDIADKVDAKLGLLRTNGPRGGSRRARRIEGNPDSRIRFVNVDGGFRIIAAIEGRTAVLLRVTNHDEAMRVGPVTTLDALTERLNADPRALRAKARDHGAARPLAAIAESTAVSDLVTSDEVGALRGYRDGLLEDWMIFLSPIQREALALPLDGITLVSGGPGTGKTVLALHRAKQYAQAATTDRKVLVTSFVTNIPQILGGLFGRLAPELQDVVEFVNVDRLARSVAQIDSGAAELSLERADRMLRAAMELHPAEIQVLRTAGVMPDYIRQEIARVIEGRGVETLEGYLALVRHGRLVAIDADARRALWTIYAAYRDACESASPSITTFSGLMAIGARAAEAQGSPRYSAAVIDESQDMTEMALRLVLGLVEGGSSAPVFLAGDTGQRIYAGGWDLADLGLDAEGRTIALSVAYRSTEEILRTAGMLGRYLSSEIYGPDGLGPTAVTMVRNGPKPTMRIFNSELEEHGWIIDQLDPDDPDLDATAILLPTNRLVDSWEAELRIAGVGYCPLVDYAGLPIPGVKVGTYSRSKGLEFKKVFLPGLDDSFPYGDVENIDHLVALGGQLYVAITRARDLLAMSYHGRSSLLLEPLSTVVGSELYSS